MKITSTYNIFFQHFLKNIMDVYFTIFISYRELETLYLIISISSSTSRYELMILISINNECISPFLCERNNPAKTDRQHFYQRLFSLDVIILPYKVFRESG